MENKITIIQKIDDDFLGRWRLLWRESGEAHFFNSPEWFLSYLATCDADYRIFSVEKNGRLEAVLPLVWVHQFGIPMLCSAGGKFLDKSSLLLRENDADIVSSLITKLMDTGNFYLHELSSDQADQIMNSASHLVRQKASVSAYIELQPNPFQFVTNKQKNKIANKIKGIREHLEYRRYVGDPEGLEIAFAVEQRSAKKKAGKMTFTTKDDKEFFRQLLQRNPDNFVVDVVFYDSVPFVYQIGFLYGKTCQGVNTAYDLNYRHLSPGKMLLHFMLEHLHKEGMEIFDFSRGESVIKKEFTKLTYTQYNVFYAKHPLTKNWLLFISKLREFILGNRMLYEGYLVLKKKFMGSKV